MKELEQIVDEKDNGGIWGVSTAAQGIPRAADCRKKVIDRYS
ncbi:MAG: hypothetical protein AAGU27_16395 [Dehalobacterium sp.]